MNKSMRRIAAAAVALTAVLGGSAATISPASALPVVAPIKAANPGVGDLQSKLALILNTGASRSARANELEAGEAGLPLIDQVGTVIAAAPPSFKWSVLGPVNVSGDTLTAGLQTSIDGFDPWNWTLTWREIDGTWKLTRDSECTVASIAMVPCSL
ncbi:hypothetical protein [Nocardia seriolae]|uniref:Low molecular weight antigen MTB12-like C-terminal domain-containing protein n=1 Tax=Nocardia seriolae TaxID=37332 RepID=A0A0B8NGS4_9NOCA|nr:hypothetical protein [Nocardia seriolae]MTJ60895.1 hypothetical protein [Nocardia seriolae]MTJ73953.1 hypothetical protein [Nocardia seriolae]MTJ90968.1 hypothetical protein [Nocardia seriolae]MTK34925.1 hypothetical protein [Nocardia seriolae]MTK38877.1 hypothetical protein [Nocardia seriolae]